MRSYTHVWLPLAILAFHKWESLDTMFNNHLMKVCLAAMFAIGLAACSSSNDTAMAPEPPPPPAPTQEEMCEDAGGRWNADMTCTSAGDLVIETALANINAADTAEAAQAAYDAVKDDVTATQGETLQAAVDARVEALATMARAAMQTTALMTAAGMIDTSDLSTQDLVDAARTAIAGLRQAIADAVDVDDTSMYQTQLDNAVDAVDMAQGGIDTATRRTNQMTALSDASDDLQAALAALSGATPTQALLDAANNALTALSTAIADGTDLTDTEKAPYQREADNAAAPINTAQMAFDNNEDEAEKARIAAMAVTASKLYAGIGAPNATASDAAQRQAAYTGTDNVDITVTWGADNTAQALTVDEDATVAERDGWTGQMFTAEPDGALGTYEAVVYSHLDDPTVTEGAAFNAGAANGGYDLDATTGETAVDTSTAAVAGRVASPSFDQSAGSKIFKPGENEQRIMLGGMFHGVSGTYYCAATDRAVGCSATVADMGFTLTGGTWTFKPTNPEAKLMDTSAADIVYASYGWWLHKSEDDSDYVASAFAIYRGTAPTVEIAALRGTATYTGGAAGKYSLRGATGGTNDAGHFTADVELNATFAETHSISGTIDNFVGADGESRNWSVALSPSVIDDAGPIAGGLAADGTPDGNNTGAQMTTWTIGDVASDAAGQWSGNLHEEGDDGVPAIATGTFYSTYGDSGNDGRMVGAFGANN